MVLYQLKFYIPRSITIPRSNVLIAQKAQIEPNFHSYIDVNINGAGFPTTDIRWQQVLMTESLFHLLN